jgi:mRNA-degrading endonuclease YafQ of YafQ-DinJ toxin-antitoxin module
MFELDFQPTFWKQYRKVTRNNTFLKGKVYETLQTLASNPQHPSLKTHRAETRKYGRKMSSHVTGDFRIIWDYDKERRLVILVLDIGGHSGRSKVYK